MTHWEEERGLYKDRKIPQSETMQERMKEKTI